MRELAWNKNCIIFCQVYYFYSSCNLYLRMSFDPVDFSNNTSCKKIYKKKAINIVILFGCRIFGADAVQFSMLCSYILSAFLSNIVAYWYNEYKDLQQFVKNFPIWKHHIISDIYLCFPILLNIYFYPKSFFY